jgi:hypothetical protein
MVRAGDGSGRRIRFAAGFSPDGQGQEPGTLTAAHRPGKVTLPDARPEDAGIVCPPCVPRDCPPRLCPHNRPRAARPAAHPETGGRIRTFELIEGRFTVCCGWPLRYPTGARPICAAWWSRRDSNPRPLRCERNALPTELLPQAVHSGQTSNAQPTSSSPPVQGFFPTVSVISELSGDIGK